MTEYSKKGFALNDERMKNPKTFGADYFDELLERIRDIRAPEKRALANRHSGDVVQANAPVPLAAAPIPKTAR